MARKPIGTSSSGIHHIILRGINRQSIFEDDEDRLKLIEVSAKYKEISQYRIFSYCLMDDHMHILLQAIQESISMIIQRVSSSYVIWYNRKHERCGHLFQEKRTEMPVLKFRRLKLMLAMMNFDKWLDNNSALMQ